MPFDNFTESDLNAFAEEMNRPRTGINIKRFAESLRRAANAADVIGEVVQIMDEAKRNNPRGLIF
jgi:hypothetical protein